MDRRSKLSALARAAQHDLSCACGESDRRRSDDGLWIYPAAVPGGGRTPILKVLTTSACTRDCAYCGLRAGRDCRRHTFVPDELAQSFDELHRAGLVHGAFLSSAVPRDPVSAMDRILDTASILRRRFAFRGYLHLKVLPGAERGQVERAISLATRVSVNLEVPSSQHLARLGDGKDFERDLLRPLRWIAERLAAREPGSRAGGARSHTTQFVVGAVDERDREIVARVDSLYRHYGLARAYFSGFQPQPGTPLAERAPAPFLREHRLYQTDFLLRSYGFTLDEIPFSADGALPRDRDPKEAWAELHPERFPLEVNRAPGELLLRVPGLGPTTVERIVAARRGQKIHGAEDLRRLGVRGRKPLGYLLFDGRLERGEQLELGFARQARSAARPGPRREVFPRLLAENR